MRISIIITLKFNFHFSLQILFYVSNVIKCFSFSIKILFKMKFIVICIQNNHIFISYFSEKQLYI